MNAKEKRALAKVRFHADMDPDKPKNGLTYIGQKATATEHEAYYNGASFRKFFPRYPWNGAVDPQLLEAGQDGDVAVIMNQTIKKSDIKVIIKDLNEIAFHLANGFTCKFVPRHGTNEIDAEFIWTKKLERSALNYVANGGVPILSFVAAWRHIRMHYKIT